MLSDDYLEALGAWVESAQRAEWDRARRRGRRGQQTRTALDPDPAEWRPSQGDMAMLREMGIGWA